MTIRRNVPSPLARTDRVYTVGASLHGSLIHHGWCHGRDQAGEGYVRGVLPALVVPGAGDAPFFRGPENPDLPHTQQGSQQVREGSQPAAAMEVPCVLRERHPSRPDHVV